jgi:hypothetical protein
VFLEEVQIVKIIPIRKPGKENSTEVSKFRPISLINTAGKVKKLLINRIMYNITVTT